MSNKKKRFIREHAEANNMSYQAAFNAVAEDVLTSFHAAGHSLTTRDGVTTSYGSTTFSAQCRCGRFVHCGDKPRTGVCFCGQRYRVVFSEKANWNLPHGSRCMDCGCAFQMSQPKEDRNPWQPVNEWQSRCNKCHQRFLAVDPNSARPGYVLVQERDLPHPIEIAGEVRCVIRPSNWSHWPYLVEQRRKGQTVLMTSDDPAIAEPYPEPIVTLADCKPGDDVFGGHWNHPPGERPLWTPLRIVAVGEPIPNPLLPEQLDEAVQQLLARRRDGATFTAEVNSYKIPDTRIGPSGEIAEVPALRKLTLTRVGAGPSWRFVGALAFVRGELWNGREVADARAASTPEGMAQLRAIILEHLREGLPRLFAHVAELQITEVTQSENLIVFVEVRLNTAPATAGSHAFTFRRQSYGGRVSDFSNIEGIVQFSYFYDHAGVGVAGSFTGEEKGGVVLGAWTERSLQPIEGRTAWSGPAHLRVADRQGDRRLTGTWSMQGVPDQAWQIDVPG